jgi:hypothetical protein
LGASTATALKNIVDETRRLGFLAGEAHLGIAFNTAGIVGLYKWLDHVAILEKRGECFGKEQSSEKDHRRA